MVQSQIQLQQFRNALEQKILLEGTLSDPRQREKLAVDSAPTISDNYQLHDVQNDENI